LPKNARLWTVCSDSSKAAVWDTENGEPAFLLEPDRIASYVAFSHDRSLIAICGWGGKVNCCPNLVPLGQWRTNIVFYRRVTKVQVAENGEEVENCPTIRQRTNTSHWARLQKIDECTLPSEPQNCSQPDGGGP
jgi:hypothetical protein